MDLVFLNGVKVKYRFIEENLETEWKLKNNRFTNENVE